MIFALIFIILFYILLNLLIGRRIYKSISLIKKINKKLFTIFYILLAGSFLIYETSRNFMPSLVGKLLAFIGSYYLGALFYLTLFFIISFFLSLIIRNKYPKVDLYIISIIVVGLLLTIGTFFSNSTIIKTYDISVDKKLKNESLKVVLVSDIHLGDLIGKDRVNKMVDSINDLDPDVVLIAGDLVDSDLAPIIKDDMLSSLSNLNTTYGTYFSLGNHDLFSDRTDELIDLLSSENIITLRNESLLINNDFYIIGRDDRSSKLSNGSEPILSDLTKILDNTKAKILIDHTPSRIDESIENNIDLQVSGHTHNGQLFPGNLLTNALFKVAYGYDKFESTNVIVSSGLGTWGPPVRIGSRSEIVLINIHN